VFRGRSRLSQGADASPRNNNPGFRGADRVEAGSLGRRSAARLGPEELLGGAHPSEGRAVPGPWSGRGESRTSDGTHQRPSWGGDVAGASGSGLEGSRRVDGPHRPYARFRTSSPSSSHEPQVSTAQCTRPPTRSPPDRRGRPRGRSTTARRPPAGRVARRAPSTARRTFRCPAIRVAARERSGAASPESRRWMPCGPCPGSGVPAALPVRPWVTTRERPERHHLRGAPDVTAHCPRV